MKSLVFLLLLVGFFYYWVVKTNQDCPPPIQFRYITLIEQSTTADIIKSVQCLIMFSEKFDLRMIQQV